jgi:hypothetical protein
MSVWVVWGESFESESTVSFAVCCLFCGGLNLLRNACNLLKMQRSLRSSFSTISLIVGSPDNRFRPFAREAFKYSSSSVVHGLFGRFVRFEGGDVMGDTAGDEAGDAAAEEEEEEDVFVDISLSSLFGFFRFVGFVGVAEVVTGFAVTGFDLSDVGATDLGLSIFNLSEGLAGLSEGLAGLSDGFSDLSDVEVVVAGGFVTVITPPVTGGRSYVVAFNSE